MVILWIWQLQDGVSVLSWKVAGRCSRQYPLLGCDLTGHFGLVRQSPVISFLQKNGQLWPHDCHRVAAMI